MKEEQSSGKYHSFAWKVRFVIGVMMMLLAMVGMIVTDVKPDGAWLYWRIMAPVYALLSLGLSFFLHQIQFRTALVTIGHEILHWLGLILAVYLVSLLVHIGAISRFQAGIEVLLLLALATFLAGVYIEPTFMIIGFALGLLVAGVGLLNQYLYTILVPAMIVGIVILFFMTRHKKPKKLSDD